MNDYIKGVAFEDNIYYALKGLPFGIALIPKPIYSYELGRYTQIDLLFITSYAIYSIEAKSARRLIGGVEDFKWWTSTYGNKNTVTVSPYLQNIRHILAMKHKLWEFKMHNVNFVNLIVVTEDALVRSDCRCIYTIPSLINKLIRDYDLNSSVKGSINIEKVYNIFK